MDRGPKFNPVDEALSPAFLKTQEHEKRLKHHILDGLGENEVVVDGNGDVWVKRSGMTFTQMQWVKLTGGDEFLCVSPESLALPIERLGRLEDLGDFAGAREVFEYNESHATTSETSGDTAA